MIKKENNYAYIDGTNLHKAIEDLGWELDYHRFYIWLSEKYGASKAYFFIGLIPKYKNLYAFLQECGFTLIFKETVYDIDGKTKGNCDAEIVLRAVRDFYEGKCNRVILVTGDGDFFLFGAFPSREAQIASNNSSRQKQMFLSFEEDSSTNRLLEQFSAQVRSCKKKKPPMLSTIDF